MPMLINLSSSLCFIFLSLQPHISTTRRNTLDVKKNTNILLILSITYYAGVDNETNKVINIQINIKNNTLIVMFIHRYTSQRTKLYYGQIIILIIYLYFSIIQSVVIFHFYSSIFFLFLNRLFNILEMLSLFSKSTCMKLSYEIIPFKSYNETCQ